MDIVEELCAPIFTDINEMFSKQLETIKNHHSFETLKLTYCMIKLKLIFFFVIEFGTKLQFMPKTLRISFEEGIQMLKV